MSEGREEGLPEEGKRRRKEGRKDVQGEEWKRRREKMEYVEEGRKRMRGSRREGERGKKKGKGGEEIDPHLYHPPSIHVTFLC